MFAANAGTAEIALGRVRHALSSVWNRCKVSMQGLIAAIPATTSMLFGHLGMSERDLICVCGTLRRAQLQLGEVNEK